MNHYVFGLTPGPIIYDIETYPNIFTFSGVHADTGQIFRFEISTRKNELKMFCLFLNKMRELGCVMVGFNNIGFDYPVIHFIYHNQNAVTVKDIFDKANHIINTPYENRNNNNIRPDHWIVPQMDLFKIHHFDNQAKATSLKVLEFNMCSDRVEELPFTPGKYLLPDEMDLLIEYNDYDVNQTLKFYRHSEAHINFRKLLTEKYQRDFTNHNDTKIGKDYLVMELEKRNPGCCYRKVNGKRKIMQTVRQSIKLAEVVFPYISFENPEFNRILSFFKNTTITETKGVFKDLTCMVNGFSFDFGTGGIHGSINSKHVRSDANYILEDWDVASYYPNIAIKNKLYPEHLGETFCVVYKELSHLRKQYPKGTLENGMIKLALNGAYGDSGSKYSPFYDTKFTMSITINGQLLLCMLAEQLFKLSELELIQINTDGLTIRYPRIYKDYIHSVMKWWENFTCLTLENVEYKSMYIRDVNNYIAIDINGKVKRKGVYEYVLDWHKNHSALIIPKAVSAYLIDGQQVESYIRNHTDIFDFMLGTKVPKSMILKWGSETIQNVSRYYVSTDGDTLEKIIPAKGEIGTYKRKNGITDQFYHEILKQVGNNWDERIHTKGKSVFKDTITAIEKGWTVQICNNIKDFTFTDLNYDYYIEKTWELIKNAGG